MVYQNTIAQIVHPQHLDEHMCSSTPRCGLLGSGRGCVCVWPVGMLSLDGSGGGKGLRKEPESGPTAGGNYIKIQEEDGAMNQDIISKFFEGMPEEETPPLITVEKSNMESPCVRANSITVRITEPGKEELYCSKQESRIDKKGPPGYEETSQILGDPAAVKAKLTEIATVLEKSENLDVFLDLFPSAFLIRQVLESEATGKR